MYLIDGIEVDSIHRRQWHGAVPKGKWSVWFAYDPALLTEAQKRDIDKYHTFQGGNPQAHTYIHRTAFDRVVLCVKEAFAPALRRITLIEELD
jgi:hypothetical protein